MMRESAPRNEIHTHYAGVATRGQPEPSRFGCGPLRAKGKANMKTKIEDRGDDEGLLCPVCGSCWIHHESVAVFNRKEDAESGIYVRAEGMNVHVSTDISQNPSSRRHGLSIQFWCEMCGNRSLLDIAQHKGVTLLQWTPVA